MFWKRKKKEKPVKDMKYWIKETKSMAIIIFVVFAFRSTFFEPFRIPTGSMIPTIAIGDFILVNKFAYGFKIPYSDLFSDPIYITKFEAPKRGDVIVFKYPYPPYHNYIKRVIGLPGDTVEIIDNIVYVNNVPMNTNSIPGKKYMEDMDDKYKVVNLDFYNINIDEKENKKNFVIQLDADVQVIQNQAVNYAPQKIPKDEYFVMGDNRHFSSDSRAWGTVPQKNIKGKALFVWFSAIIPFLDDNPPKLRLHRIGTPLN